MEKKYSEGFLVVTAMSTGEVKSSEFVPDKADAIARGEQIARDNIGALRPPEAILVCQPIASIAVKTETEIREYLNVDNDGKVEGEEEKTTPRARSRQRQNA
jgi:hypothetical protein